MEIEVKRRKNVENRGEDWNIIDEGVRNIIVRGGKGGCRIKKNFLSINEGKENK